MAKATQPPDPGPGHRPRGRSRRPLVATAALALASCLILPGCQTTAGKKVMALISPRYDESLADGMVRPEDADPNRFLSRYLSPARTPHTSSGKEPKSLSLGTNGWRPVKEAPNPEADKQLEAATALYRQGKYDEARPSLVKLAKDHKGESWGMKAQFLLGESYYEQGQYVWAHDAYETLLKEYPGDPEFVDKAVAREYAIAEKWFAYAPDPKGKPAAKFAFWDRFRGRTPLLDSEGYAVKALEKVREHDVTGPLSDDACLRLADFYMAKKDYETAATYYDELSVEHPKSEHVRRAQLASIDAKLKGYMGPEYDGKPLEAALESIKQTRAMFPERTEENEKLYQTVDLIYDQHAERAYRVGLYYLDYYKKTGYGAASAEYYFGLVNARWPKTEWAKKSKDELAVLAKAPRKEAQTSRMMTMPGSIAPFSSGSGTTAGGMSGMGMGGGGGGMGGMGMGGMGMPGMPG